MNSIQLQCMDPRIAVFLEGAIYIKSTAIKLKSVHKEAALKGANLN